MPQLTYELFCVPYRMLTHYYASLLIVILCELSSLQWTVETSFVKSETLSLYFAIYDVMFKQKYSHFFDVETD